jgi:ribonuclease P/MRP protein subunit POP5
MVRFKERYLLVNIVYPEGAASKPKKTDNPVPDILAYNQPTTDNLLGPSLLRAIRAQVASLFGDYGSGAVDRSLQVKYFSLATSTFILRVSRSHYRLVWAALTLMDRVPAKNGKPCIFRVVRVSGTIRKIEEEAIRRAKQMMLAAKEEVTGKKPDSDALGALFGKSGSGRGEFDMMDVDSGASEGEQDADGG